jgi:hypothetical protein
MKARRTKIAKPVFADPKIGREVVRKLCDSKDIKIEINGKLVNIKQI